MKHARIITTALMVLTALTAATATTHVHRYLLSAGANNGGKDRVLLRYAVSDATAFASVLTDMGGVERKNAIVLSDPSGRELLAGIANLGKLMAKDRAADPNIRSEVFVYYSGHADEGGLKLGSETLGWSEFRSAVSGLDAEVRVAVLDACGSGAITRTKGGVARPAFLSDASSNMKGYAFLTSSNENESSQESDRIRSSYFTHALLSGMRGAADMTGDGKVTINEAYQYAFNETLHNTQNTQAGTQHPSRDMNLAGTGDVVMTDLHETSATLSLDVNLEGRFFIRDGSGNLFAELRKFRGRVIELGMPPGKYSIEIETPSRAWMAGNVEIVAGKRAALSMNDMKAMVRKVAVARGNDNGVDGSDSIDTIDDIDDINTADVIDTANDIDTTKLSVSMISANTDSLTQNQLKKVLTNPLLDSACREPYRMNVGSVASAGNTKPERGFQLAVFTNTAGAELCGTQLSSIVNIARKDMNGAQINPIVNIALERFNGAQVSIINLMNNGDKAVQTGVINIAKDVGYVQTGVTNIAVNSKVQTGVTNIAVNSKVQTSVTNIAANSKVQIGVLNIAQKTSHQIGLVNIAAHSENTPIGLLNIVGNGIFELSYYMDTDNLMGVSARTGTPYLYSLIEYAQPIGALDVWPKAYGFGLGTRFGMTGPFYVNLDLLQMRFYNDADAFFDRDRKLGYTVWEDVDIDSTTAKDTLHQNTNYLFKLRLGLNYAPTRYVTFSGGAYLNCLVADKYGKFNINMPVTGGPATLDPNDPNSIHTSGNDKRPIAFGGKHEIKVRMWPGVYAGITVGIQRFGKVRNDK